MEAFDLNSFLNEQREAGTEDSRGEFTVSASDAARKLARFALPEAYSWVLKLLQAAAGWKAPKLRITQTREFTSFCFALSRLEDYPSREELLETLVSTEIGGTEPLQRLCIALRSLVEQTGLSFVLGVQFLGEMSYSVYAGHDVSQLRPEVRESWAKVHANGLRLSVSHQGLGEHLTGRVLPRFMLAERRDLAIAQELEKRAFCFPCPVMLDGRKLNDVWAHTELGFSPSHRPVFLSGAKATPRHPTLRMNFSEQRITVFQGPLSSAELARAAEASPQSRNFESSFVLHALDPGRLSGVGGGGDVLRAGPGPHLAERPHKILWICDGVVVSREELHPRTPCWVARLFLFVNGTGLQTDLTGLSITDSPEKAARLKRALEATSLALEEERPNTESYVLEQAEANKRTLKQENRAEVIERLPPALGPFRKLLAAGATGHYEGRSKAFLKMWERMLKVDLDKLVTTLHQAAEDLT